MMDDDMDDDINEQGKAADDTAVIGKDILVERVTAALAAGPNGGAVTQAGSRRAVNATLEAIAAALAAGERVQLPGFGTFRIVELAPRAVRTPNGTAMTTQGGPAVRFHASDKLAKAVRTMK